MSFRSSKSWMRIVPKPRYMVGWSLLTGLAFQWEVVPTVTLAADVVSGQLLVETIAQSIPPIQAERPVLKLGSQGSAVSELQAALRLLGYYTGSVDGLYQESTASAVARFQQSAGLNADGIVGSDTWNRLFPSESVAPMSEPTSFKTPASSFPVPSSLQTTTSSDRASSISNNEATLPVLRYGMQGPAVVQLQERLKALGFFSGLVDGIFGTETQTAVKAAQQKFTLQPDGIVGSDTWRALLR
ncbi:MAG TPA: peptidoglycan-binding protein [Coleofasciculaceae cyanobacterium]